MPSSLSERRDLKVRNLIYDNWNPSNTNGYDPSLDTDKNLFVPVTTNWYAYGEHNPAITITNFNGNIIGGGESGWTGMQGDGSGVNQDRDETGRLTIHIEHDQMYNGLGAREQAKLFRDEISGIVQRNASGDGEVFNFSITPFESSPQNELDGVTVFQFQAEVGFDWQKTP